MNDSVDNMKRFENQGKLLALYLFEKDFLFLKVHPGFEDLEDDIARIIMRMERRPVVKLAYLNVPFK